MQLLDEKVFGRNAGEPFIIHCLKKLLANEGRHNLRTNIEQNDVIIYSDYSKGSLNIVTDCNDSNARNVLQSLT